MPRSWYRTHPKDTPPQFCMMCGKKLRLNRYNLRRFNYMTGEMTVDQPTEQLVCPDHAIHGKWELTVAGDEWAYETYG